MKKTLLISTLSVAMACMPIFQASAKANYDLKEIKAAAVDGACVGACAGLIGGQVFNASTTRLLLPNLRQAALKNLKLCGSKGAAAGAVIKVASTLLIEAYIQDKKERMNWIEQVENYNTKKLEKDTQEMNLASLGVVALGGLVAVVV